MDPVAIKFAQLIGVEVIGAVMLFGGLWMLFRNLAGKSHLIFEGGRIGIRLTNASPGAIAALIGLGLIWLSLNSKVVREETITEDAPVVQPSGPPKQSEPPSPSAPAPKETSPPSVPMGPHDT